MRQDARLRVVIFDRGIANPYSRGLARGLERGGAHVVIAGPNHADTSDGDPRVIAVYPRTGRRQFAAKAVDGILGAARLARLVVSFRPHVLHFQWGARHDHVIARILRSVTRAPVVFTVHNPIPRDGDGGFDERMVRLADVFIVHGARLREGFLRRHDVSADRVYVVPHGNFEHAIVRFDRADARARLSLPPDEPVFTYFGQLVPRKGLETLMSAFHSYCESGLAGTLVIVGATYGVDEAALRARVAAYERRVRWMTRPEGVPAVEIDLAVSAATQVVLPFHSATQSGSVLYAMTHGRCVVTTDTGEIAATVGRHGIIVPPRDPLALAGALALAAADPARCDIVGAEARAHVLREFDWDDLATQTVGAYRAATASVEHRLSMSPVRHRP